MDYTIHGEVRILDYAAWIPKRISDLRIEKGVSARDMSLSLGQSASYINKIENGRTLPSLTGFLYICEYFNISPQEFFNVNASSPNMAKELVQQIEKLTPAQSSHILQIVKDLTEGAEA